jgi:hypothetical protein
MPEPIIVSQSAQPQSSTPKRHKNKHLPPPPAKGKPDLKYKLIGSQQQHIVFAGSLLGSPPQSFSVLAGEEAPTITGGWAAWNEIERPQRAPLTVVKSYTALALTVPILFDAVRADGIDVLRGTPNYSGGLLEADIEALEWMAGRGKLYSEGTEATGVSPRIRVYSVSASGREHPLIPPNAQEIDWVLTGLTYDPNPSRNEDGWRIRQAATVELKEYLGGTFDTTRDSSSARAKARKADKGYVVMHTTQSVNTVQAIASFRVEQPGAAKQIAEYNRKYNKKWRGGAGWEKVLPKRTAVFVPRALVDGLG